MWDIDPKAKKKVTIEKAKVIKQIMEYIINNYDILEDNSNSQESKDAWNYVLNLSIDAYLTEDEYSALQKMINIR